MIVVLLLCFPSHTFALSSLQDTDGDGIPDTQEDINNNGIPDPGETDPLKADTDGGGESDNAEITGKRNPLDPKDDLTADEDGDGLANGIELLKGSDPKTADTDNDGVNDNTDPFPNDKKYSLDANANGLPDEWETVTNLSTLTTPQSRTSDPDNDNLTNAEELARGTDPLRADTDSDGINDSAEIQVGQNPRENACLAYQLSPSTFKDMTSHWAKDVVTNLANLHWINSGQGIVKGYATVTPNGEETVFKPDQFVTRFELLKMVLASTCRKLSATPDADVQEFIDVPKQGTDNESPDALQKRLVIYSATHDRIVQGYADYSFKPDAPVTRAEAVKIITIAVKGWNNESLDTQPTSVTFSDTSSDQWYWPYLELSVKRELIKGYEDHTFRPSSPITRAEVSKIIEKSIRQNPFINGYVLPEER